MSNAANYYPISLEIKQGSIIADAQPPARLVSRKSFHIALQVVLKPFEFRKHATRHIFGKFSQVPQGGWAKFQFVFHLFGSPDCAALAVFEVERPLAAHFPGRRPR